uniref:Amblyomma 40 33 family member n=1 Tax=Rhipicephalus appendiculatus TaxID=34631 RepID=A0A131YXX1_RHIAP
MLILRQISTCLYAWILMATLVDTSYRDYVLRKYFNKLVPPVRYFRLPDHYFALRNPFDVNGTQYRFNLTDGKLRVKTPSFKIFDGKACKISFSPTKTVQCIFPIDGSTANYTGKLSYGRHVVQTFQVKLTAEAYTYENSGWNNPIDISVYMETKKSSGKARLVPTSIFVTDFIVDIIAEPEFRNFTVFHGNSTIISKVWDGFWDYAYRRGRPDMKKVAKNSYAKYLGFKAKIPITESAFWKL